jgi:hypothetical protein
MKKFLFTFGMAVLLAVAAVAQNTNLAFLPGKLAVFRGGNGTFTFSDRRFPVFVDEYDTATTNQAAPIMSIALPTNGQNSLWFNLHAGSEGQGISRSMDRQYIEVTGYHGDLTNVTTTPSSATDCTRGFGQMDAFTNFNVEYQSQDWFGIAPGITQNNPRGIATDGTNDFWGCGTVAGTQTSGNGESGTLFYNPNLFDGLPTEVQNECESGYEMRIINGVLYMVAKDESGGAANNGVYDFVDFNNNLVPLPDAPGNFSDTCYTNLILNFGSVNGVAVANVLTFDMNTSNTVAYAADETLGIIKYVYTDGAWNEAYVFNPTNLGTASQPSGNGGCFGIAVDFTSSTNPIIYATTTETADSKDDICSNRLISIVDTGSPPGTNMVANTLAVANGANEGFRGLDFTPDLRPEIVSQPQPIDTTTNVAASFNVTEQSVYTVGYQWQENGVNVSNNSNITGANSSILSFLHSSLTNQGNYTVVITNAYGSVTSSVVSMTVSAIALPPGYTNAVLKLTNYIGDNVNITATKVEGTPTFTYQWFDGTTALSDGPDGNGSGYLGSQTSQTLTITNAQLTDTGSYYLGITNSVGGTNVLIANLTVLVRPPSIPSGGQPVSLVVLAGETNSLSVSSAQGTPPLTYAWYQGNTNPVTQLSTVHEFLISSNVLTFAPAGIADATNYFCVVANSAGSVTSQVASVTVIIPPAHSFLAYSNQLYTQNFDSLPNPGTTDLNTIGGGGPITIGGITYDLSNPFDFAFPTFFTNAPVGGLGLSNTMAGWYGECDGDTSSAQIGAQDGDQTTGGIISFGVTNAVLNQNRALGLIATSTSGETHFGLKVVNETAANLNYFNLSFVGEYWKTGSRPKEVVFGYTVDSTASLPFLAGGVIAAATNNLYNPLNFGSNNFVIQNFVAATNGTLPGNQTNMAASNVQLNQTWAPGSALWLVWSIDDAGGSGQGFAIDNLAFSASVVPIYTTGSLTNIVYSSTTGYGGETGLSFNFTGPSSAGTSFSIWSTTNLLTPLSQWKDLGHPTTESPAGTYNFTDPSATSNSSEFYRVTSP